MYQVRIHNGGFELDGYHYRHDALQGFEGKNLLFRSGKVYDGIIKWVEGQPLCEPKKINMTVTRR